MPDLFDTRTMASVLASLGAKVEVLDNEMLVNTDGVGSVEPNADEIQKIRGGFFVIGPLVARFGEAVVALPGGCNIGARPVDLYIRGLQSLGAVVELRSSFLHFIFKFILEAHNCLIYVYIEWLLNLFIRVE